MLEGVLDNQAFCRADACVRVRVGVSAKDGTTVEIRVRVIRAES